MWLKPQGYAQVISPRADLVKLDHIRSEEIPPGLAQWDTATCFHCNSVFHVSARMRPEDIGGLCKMCMQPICPKCLDKPCKPWEKHMDELENKIERQRTVSFYGK